MPEPKSAQGAEFPDAGAPDTRAPDHFDRLLARHTGGAVPRAGVARVRPRLAGPFERVETVRGSGLPEPDGAAPIQPSVTQLPYGSDELTRPSMTREVRHHSERDHTVVHTERTADPARVVPGAPAPAEAPLLRPAATPVPRALPGTSRRTEVRERGAGAPPRNGSSRAVPGPGAEAATAAVPAPLRPSAVDTAAARDAVRQSPGRRGARGGGEQVVHVQIGRLEVTAAGAAGSDTGRAGRSAPVRQGATVSLQDYLARGRDA
ncbi:hypothetical protein [Streptomyces longispororuber]|uniref:hypothetical protein n=1 Tax=Streptomyces longispororuber TaxID=68230 RepID=UPI00210E1EA6|nr:hypothetical protein [Streptomyces longispororuber]MCQ4212453.1 hypothetical protein [Streptomyces longispororuber]